MHYEGCGLCLTTVECLMCGRVHDDEDAWLFKKWKTEVNVDPFPEATLPHGPAEEEDDTYEASVLANRVSALSN